MQHSNKIEAVPVIMEICLSPDIHVGETCLFPLYYSYLGFLYLHLSLILNNRGALLYAPTVLCMGLLHGTEAAFLSESTMRMQTPPTSVTFVSPSLCIMTGIQEAQ